MTHQRLAQHVRARPTRVSLSAASRATAAQAGCHGRPAWLSWPRASSSKKRAHQGGKAHTRPADPLNQPAHGRATTYSATPCTTKRAGSTAWDDVNHAKGPQEEGGQRLAQHQVPAAPQMRQRQAQVEDDQRLAQQRHARSPTDATASNQPTADASAAQSTNILRYAVARQNVRAAPKWWTQQRHAQHRTCPRPHQRAQHHTCSRQQPTVDEPASPNQRRTHQRRAQQRMPAAPPRANQCAANTPDRRQRAGCAPAPGAAQ